MHVTSLPTLILIAAFSLSYLYVLFRKTACKELDLYDLMMLSSVAVVPSFFAFAPGLVTDLSRMIGVGFPFLLMFGVLFAVLFIFIHRLTVKMHQVQSESRQLVQEISLLRQQIEHGASGG